MIINHPGQSENLLSRIILPSCRKPWLFLKDPLMLLTLRGIYLNLSEVSKPICTGSFTLEHYKLKNCGCWWYMRKNIQLSGPSSVSHHRDWWHFINRKTSSNSCSGRYIEELPEWSGHPERRHFTSRCVKIPFLFHSIKPNRRAMW